MERWKIRQKEENRAKWKQLANLGKNYGGYLYTSCNFSVSLNLHQYYKLPK